MAQSDFTKKTRRRLWAIRVLDWCLVTLPVVGYVVFGLLSHDVEAVKKVVLVLVCVLAGIISVTNVFMRQRLRCTVWIVIIGLYVSVKEWLLPLIIIMAVTAVLDDLAFSPAINYYQSKLAASKTIDERMGSDVRENI